MLPDDVLDVIQHPGDLRGKERVARDLEVTTRLRDAGVTKEGVEAIFRQYPIGDYYRGLAAAAGETDLLDTICADAVAEYDKAGWPERGMTEPFTAYYHARNDILWIHLPTLVNWWNSRYGGEQKAIKKTLRAMMRERLLAGSYIVKRTGRWIGGRLLVVDGIKVEEMRRLGLLKESAREAITAHH